MLKPIIYDTLHERYKFLPTHKGELPALYYYRKDFLNEDDEFFKKYISFNGFRSLYQMIFNRYKYKYEGNGYKNNPKKRIAKRMTGRVIDVFLDIMFKDLILNNEVFVFEEYGRYYGFMACTYSVKDMLKGKSPEIIICKDRKWNRKSNRINTHVTLLGKYKILLEEELKKEHRYETVEMLKKRYQNFINKKQNER